MWQHQVFTQCCHVKRRGEGDSAEVSNFSPVRMEKGGGDSAETLTFVATGKGRDVAQSSAFGVDGKRERDLAEASAFCVHREKGGFGKASAFSSVQMGRRGEKWAKALAFDANGKGGGFNSGFSFWCRWRGGELCHGIGLLCECRG